MPSDFERSPLKRDTEILRMGFSNISAPFVLNASEFWESSSFLHKTSNIAKRRYNNFFDTQNNLVIQSLFLKIKIAMSQIFPKNIVKNEDKNVNCD